MSFPTEGTSLSPCRGVAPAEYAYSANCEACYNFQHMTAHKILLVEDSEPLRKVLAEKLRDEKYEVTEASGGDEGLKLGQEIHPDMVITDIVMFPMDGLEMAKQIRAAGSWGEEVYIIALTNQNSSEEEARLKDLRLNAYLVKAETALDDVVKHVKEVFKK